MDSVVTTVETRIQNAVLTAIEESVIPRVELAMKSTNASSWRRMDGNVLELNQKDFSGRTESL